VTDTVLNVPPDALLDNGRQRSEPPTALPSAHLKELADLAAAAVQVSEPAGAAAPVLSEQALADVLAAVDASTAANTKAAYRSDWARFTTWSTERGFARCRSHR